MNPSILATSEKELKERLKKHGGSSRQPTYYEEEHKRKKMDRHRAARVKQRIAQLKFRSVQGHKMLITNFKGEENGDKTHKK